MKNRTKQEVEQEGLKRRRFFLSLLTFINGYLLLSFFFGEMGMLKVIKMTRERSHLTESIQSLQRENAVLTQRVVALKTDPHTIEVLARDRLGLAKEGDLIYEFFDR